jgi:quercetin dioxygenase-like cupin family protein
MNRQDAEAKYKKMGLETDYVVDEPGKVYEPHRHSEIHIFFTVKGNVRLKLDNKDWQTLEPGQETMIANNQLHEAVVGSEGWEFVFATTPEGMKQE